MSDLSVLGREISKEWHELMGVFKGKVEPSLAADAKAILDTLNKIGNGIRGASKDVPGIVVLVEQVVAQTAVAASARGMNLAADGQLAQTVMEAARAFEQAYKDYEAGAALVAVTPTNG